MVYGCAITRERIVLTFFAVWSTMTIHDNSSDLSQLSALSGRSVLHGRLRRSYVQPKCRSGVVRAIFCQWLRTENGDRAEHPDQGFLE